MADHGILDGIAVVGLACRFPGARNAEQFWANLAGGVESVRFFSDDELLAAGTPARVLEDPAYVKAAPVLEDVDLFDAALFGYSPREAELMDPQQRLFLETAWEALEDSSFDPGQGRERVGVYAGARLDTYWLGFLSGREAVHGADALQALIGNDKDYLATQLSYRLDLRGPSIGVQTACSTSLVAVALASQGLLSFQCDVALAGGVTVRVPQVSGYYHRPGGIASPDGHCRAFSADARGSVFGSGVGVVVLKRLEDALRDGDRVRAVVRGSALNNDGALKAGYTAPSEEGQAEVIATAQALAGVEPETITYVEAHGTGTPLGDPIEVAALRRAFRSGSGGPAHCGLGSVKTNIGHLDCAAGVAGLIKTVLALEKGMIPPSLNFDVPNPQLGLEGSPFYVNTELRPWESDGPRRAGVSSFGIGGTNAHVVLEEAPRAAPPAVAPAAPAATAARWQVLPLSGQTPTALEAVATRLASHLEDHPELAAEDVAYTLQVGRRPLRRRRIVVCRDTADAVAALRGEDAERVGTGAAERHDRPVTFLFPGQGAQYPGMGAGLYRDEPVFREELDRCAEILRPHLGLDLRQVLVPATDGDTGRGTTSDGARLQRTELAQPALFAVSYALARLWMARGVRPEALAGHSIGEYAAACLAGVFSLEDGLALVAARGRLMQACPPGSMLAVALREGDLVPRLPAEVSLAAVNAPALCVVSGPARAVAELQRNLAADGVGVRPLHTSHAFHSAAMEAALEPFTAELRRVRLAAPRLPVLSNRTGGWLTAAEATDPDYWAAQLREPVRWKENVEHLLDGPRVVLEVGPGRSLATLVRQHPEAGSGTTVLTSLRHPKDAAEDGEHLASTLGRLWLAGAAVDWRACHPERPRRVALPTYPFEGRRFWIDDVDGLTALAESAGPRAERPLEEWFQVPVWRQAPAVSGSPAPSAGAGPWLVFAPPGEEGEALVRRLRDGGEVVAVLPGDGFAADGEGRFRVDPSSPGDHAALLAALRGEGRLPSRVVHGWAAGPVPDAGETEAAVDRDLDLGFHSLLSLLQALAAEADGGAAPIDLRVLTRGVHAVHGDEALAPARAAVLGICAVAPHELPGLAVQAIDLAQGDGSEVLELLMEELASVPEEPVVALRTAAVPAARRWLREYAPLRLGESPSPGALRRRGVYLVTGGWGGLGLTLARYLAERVEARLVMVGRSGGTADAVRDLEERGAEVLSLAADVTRRDEMEAMLQAAEERFGPLHGVFHAAGVAGGGLLRLKTREAARRVLAPKVRGAAVLSDLLAGRELDFLVFFASTIGLTGAFGQVDYAAANTVLDAVAHRRGARQPGLTVTVDWDGWRDLGMTAADGPPRAAEPVEGTPFRRAWTAPGGRRVFAARLDPADDWVLDEHRILGRPVLPGTAHLDLMRAAADAEANGGGALELRQVTFQSPLVARDGGAVEVRVVLDEGTPEGRPVRVLSRPAADPEAPWEEHARALSARLPHAAGEPAPIVASRPFAGSSLSAAVLPGGAETRRVEVDPADDGERARYMDLGPRWDVVRRVEVGEDRAITVLELPEALAGDLERFPFHPALLDRATSFAVRYLVDGYYLPLAYDRIVVKGPLGRRLVSHLRRRPDDDHRFDLSVRDEDGVELVAVEGFAVRPLEDPAVVRRAVEGPAVPAADVAGLDEPLDGPVDGPGLTAGSLPGPRGIDPERGLEALVRLLAWGKAHQVVVSPRDMDAAFADARAFSAALLAEAGPEERRQASRDAADPAPAGHRHPRPDLAVAYRQPGDDVERAVVAIWEGLLGIGGIGADDDFFELGGHSLLAVRLAGELRQELGVEVPPGDLFATPTVAGVAALVREAAGDAPPAVEIAPVPRDGEPPLSFAQERQWFLAELEPESPLYNHAAGLRVTGRLDAGALAASLQGVVRRHETLRSTFVPVQGRPRLRIAPPAPWQLPRIDLSALPEARRRGESRRVGRSEARRPFDLSRGPLLRTLLFRLRDEAHEAWFVFHHIVGDHWSAGVLIREVATLYAAVTEGRPSPLPELPIQYADFAHWQRRWLSGEVLERELAYWRQRLEGPLPVLELPTDRPRPAVVGPGGAQEPVSLSPELSRRLRDFARREGASPFMVLLAVLAILLHRWTGQEDLVVGAPVAGRNRPELDGLIGYFINALALRTDLSGDPTVRELVARVREVTLGAYAHQELPFEKLVEELRPRRHPGRSPVFQVVFNYQNADPASAAGLPGLSLEPLPAERRTAKYDFTLYMWEAEDRLAGAIEYKTDLFAAATMARLREELVILAERAVTAPETRLGALVAALDHRETEKRMVRQDEVSRSNLKKLKITRRRSVNLSQEDLVRKEYLDGGTEGDTLPLVIRPNLDDVDLASWARSNQEMLEKELLTHGGILFRGFAVPDAEAFESFVNTVTPDLVNYVEGSSPRVMVGDKVYTSTEYPAEYFVSLHNELSYAHKWPSKIFFYCDVEPREGGETPIVDSRKLWQAIDPEIRRKFREKGVLYTRNLHGDQGAGLSWQTVFENTDRDFVESYCEEGGIEYRWTDDGGLATRQKRPATVCHPETGERVWFNQVDQWHPSNLGSLADALLATTDEEDLPINATFGDGTPLDPEELEHVREKVRETMVTFPWQQGDVLMLDNTLTAHGRMPYKAPRRVLVAMGGGTVHLSQLEA